MMKPKIYFVLLILLLVIPVGVSGQNYLIDLCAIALVYGLFAASVDFSFGYCGVINLGSALYFGLGGYFMAYGLKAGWAVSVSVLSGLVVCLVLAGIIGLVAFRIKASPLHYGLIGLALSLAAQQLAIGLYEVAGGSNGITNVSKPILDLGFFSLDLADPTRYYYSICLVVFVLVFLLVAITNSHFGRMMICVREDPERAEALGYNHRRVKLYATLVTVVISSIAGALYVPLSGIAHPGLFGIVPNMLVLVWVAIGGQGSILGPFTCAVLLKLLESELGSAYENVYILVIGIVFMLMVIIWPRGISGSVQVVLARLRQRQI